MSVLFFLGSASAASPAQNAHKSKAQVAPKKVIRKTASSPAKKKPRDQIQTLRSYDLELSNTGEVLVFEEQMLDRLPAYFIEHRQGKKTKAIASVFKKEFDSWARGMDVVLQKTKTVTCDKAPKIKRTVQSTVTTRMLCDGSLSQAERDSLNKVRSEVMGLLNKESARKAAR